MKLNDIINAMAAGDLLKKLNADLAAQKSETELREAEQRSLDRASERINPRGLTATGAIIEGAVPGSDRWPESG